MYCFADRRDAGRQLAGRLRHFWAQHPVVVGLPRGGVPVAFEVARALGAPLDVVIVRKLGVPAQPELGMGAVGEGGVRVLNDRIVGAARVTDEELRAVEARERNEVLRRARRYRGTQPMIPLRGRTVIIVDDGLATGVTARAAVDTVRAHGAAQVVLAVPVAAPDTARALARVADQVVVVYSPQDLRSVGEWYADFTQTADAEVVALLDEARPGHREAAPAGEHGPVLRARSCGVVLDVAGVRLDGHLAIPPDARGIVVFAHGSGSSRHSPRNLAVARTLHEAGFGTLLFDLLTEAESVDRTNVFDLRLLARRLREATHWLRMQPGCASVPIGYFGASTGAGAALLAAGDPGLGVQAIVSRGGRPDLAGPGLADVTAPTLLIVGSRDELVLDLNREAAAALRGPHEVAVVPGASHLFDEPGTLEQAAQLAVEWFTRYLHADHDGAPTLATSR